MRVIAVILNWKRADLTIACAKSVIADDPTLRILIVDNASDDGSVERIRAELPNIEILETDHNRGYAGGNLFGGDAAVEREADAILVLNNDLEIEPGCIQRLVKALAAEPALAIVAPLSLDAANPDVVEFYSAKLDRATMNIQPIGRGARGLPTADVDSAYAPGSAFLIRREAWLATGGFDERFFLVWEDVDLSLRAVEAGYRKPRIIAAAHVRHHGSHSFGGVETPLYRYFLARNAYLMAGKHRKGLGRYRTLRRLDRRFEGWARSASDPAIAAALRLGASHGRAERFGPTPNELTPTVS